MSNNINSYEWCEVINQLGCIQHWLLAKVPDCRSQSRMKLCMHPTLLQHRRTQSGTGRGREGRKGLTSLARVRAVGRGGIHASMVTAGCLPSSPGPSVAPLLPVRLDTDSISREHCVTRTNQHRELHSENQSALRSAHRQPIRREMQTESKVRTVHREQVSAERCRQRTNQHTQPKKQNPASLSSHLLPVPGCLLYFSHQGSDVIALYNA